MSLLVSTQPGRALRVLERRFDALVTNRPAPKLQVAIRNAVLNDLALGGRLALNRLPATPDNQK